MIEKYLLLSYLALAFLLAIKFGFKRNVAPCGLWGCISSVLSQQEIQMTLDLGVISSLRGVDSTGLLIGSKKGNKRTYNIIKDTSTSAEFLNFGAVPDALKNGHKFLLMGHTRAATLGDVSFENAQPFKYGDTMGTHNGTISKLAVGNRSDSSVLIEKINTVGLEKTLEDIEFGAYALALVSQAKHSLAFVRNSQRTLFFGTDKMKSTTYWSSEEEMLKFISARSRVPLDITPLEEGVVYWRDMSKYSMEWEKIPVEKKTVVVIPAIVKPATQPSLVTEAAKRHPFLERPKAEPSERPKEKPILSLPLPSGQSSKLPVVTSAQTELLREGAKQKKEKSAENELTYRGYNGVLYGPAYIRPLLQQGCSVCTSVEDITDTIWWLSKTDYVCHSCKSTVQYLQPGHLYEGRNLSPVLN